MKQAKITIGGQVVRAKLMHEDTSEFIRVLEQNVPIEGKLNHAKICDNEVFFLAPFHKDEKENPVVPVAGDIGYYPVRQTITVWYGPMQPLGPSTVFAKIYPEDLPKFAGVASQVWANQGTEIKFEIVEV